ncbi:hypothetical protein SUDANB91_00795 [Streptomyces sp. SudanB91_2054]
MHLLGRYYRQVEAGRKTIEVRTATPDKRAVAVGDTVCVVVPADPCGSRQPVVLAGQKTILIESGGCRKPVYG